LEGLGHAEIAARLNVSLRSVHRYIAKGYEQCIMAVM
ncbi:sigma factor-like helix-turn-helix DNA-binding protein, partial [Achromobacter xylosoxidans]